MRSSFKIYISLYIAVIDEISSSLKKRGVLTPKVSDALEDMREEAKNNTSTIIKKKKRPITGYNLFVREQRVNERETNPELTSQQITGVVSKQWSKLEQHVRDDYVARARSLV
jgi:hypothetical protein